MTDYRKYINALRKCATEHENDRTSTGHIIVSDLCRDTANLLETIEKEPTTNNGISNRSIIYKAKESKEIQEDLDKFSKLNEPTTKDNLVVDAVSRVEVMQLLQEHWLNGTVAHRVIAEIGNDIQHLPPVTPQEPMVIPIAEVKFDEDKLKELVDRAVLTVIPQEPRWIPVSEKLPNDRDWYLGIFKEPDTGWINPLPFICDYAGRETKATTKEYWILRGFTDRDERIDYYFNLECVAWMPLPKQYGEEEE